MYNINLRQLEVLAAIVECGSFTGAANRLYLAQSTVSSHIRALEQELGIILFRRESKKHIQLTPDGKIAYQHARDILLKCAIMEKSMSADSEHELVLGASSAPSKGLVPELVRGFAQANPDCRFTIHSGDSDQIHRMLLDGAIQLGFMGSSDNRQSLIYEAVMEDHLVMVTPNTPYYAGLQQSGALGRQLLAEPMIIRENGSETQKTIDNYLSSISADSRRMRIVARVSNPTVLCGLVERGLGVSMLSDAMVREQVKSGALLQFELDDPPIRRRIYMAYNRKGSLSGLVKDFISFTKARCASAPGGAAGAV